MLSSSLGSCIQSESFVTNTCPHNGAPACIKYHTACPSHFTQHGQEDTHRGSEGGGGGGWGGRSQHRGKAPLSGPPRGGGGTASLNLLPSGSIAGCEYSK